VFQSGSKSYNFDKTQDNGVEEATILLALKRGEEWSSLFFDIPSTSGRNTP